jgi:hypothetical protein
MSNVSRLVAALAVAGSAVLSLPVHAAATITVINGDPPGVGFNDATPATPVGGNAGTTLGQQRLNLYNAVAAKWASELTSSVPILVYATWEPLSCDDTSAVLGSAGPTFVFSDFPGAPFPNTWYASALANKLAGDDLAPPDPTSTDPLVNQGVDIRARFNVNLGQPGCLDGTPFYLGFDGNAGSKVDFYPVLLHEMGHGLGFTSITDGQTGRRLGGRNAQPGVWEHFMYDNDAGKKWIDMTNAERKASATNPRKLAWTGPTVVGTAPSVLVPGTPELVVASTTVPSVSGTYLVGDAEFGPALTGGGVTGPLETLGIQPGSTGPGCDPFSPLNRRKADGAILMIDRGDCAFTIKVKNAQDAGAIAVIIVDNVAGSPPPSLGGDDPSIHIPAVRISKEDGKTLRSAIRPRSNAIGTTATLRLNLSQLAGADLAGRVLLYTPDPYQPGSSVSHWDTIAKRNLLMEPFINSDLTHNVKSPDDLTFELFKDIGW